MKSFIAILMAALMVLSFVSVASAADTVEIRSPVMEGKLAGERNLSNLTANGTTFTEFGAFFYNIDDNVGSEYLDIITTATDDTIPDGDLVYTAIMKEVDYEYVGWENDSFMKLGFLAKEYVPINDDPQILSKLILDDDEKYTMRVGETLDLGEGFAITPKQIDVEGDKVWLELTKDGKFLDDEVYNTVDNPDDSSWDYEVDVAGEDDVVIMRVHINEVFQGQVDSLAIIEGLWLISDEPLEIADDEEFGKLEVTSTTATSIILKSTEDITLSKDKTIDVTDSVKIKTADSDDLRFYFFEEITEPGTYEIRGTVAAPSGAGSKEWDYTSFAGFFYDLDDNLASETLNITWGSDNRTVAEPSGVVYTAIMKEVDYTYVGWANDSFMKMGFLAEEYVPINNDPQILSKLILDDDEKYTLRVGQTLDLGEGFAITPKQIDVEGDKVWLELTKDGKFLDDEVYNTLGNVDSSSWDYDVDVAGEDDIVIMRVHINEVFQGQVDSLAIIEGLWLISDEPMEIEDDEDFGMLEVSTTTATSITLTNIDDEFDLGKDDVIELTETISLRVADSDDDEVRFYPFTEVTIEDEDGVTPEDVTPEDVTPEDVTPEDVTPEDVTPENVTPENVTPEDVTPVDEDGDEDEDVPGFEAVFAIAGLLAVAYFVRRN
jgi:S-layer protein (TIGR01567 family)